MSDCGGTCCCRKRGKASREERKKMPPWFAYHPCKSMQGCKQSPRRLFVCFCSQLSHAKKRSTGELNRPWSFIHCTAKKILSF